jgi:hypothetical protein
MQTLGDTRRALAQWGTNHSAQLFSSLKATGVEEAEQAIAPWFAMGLAGDDSGQTGGLIGIEEKSPG